MRTVVVHTGGIGDFLLTCPVIAFLSRDGPVELLGQPERLQIAVAGGIAVAAHETDRVDFTSVFSHPSQRFREFAARFDRAVVWMRDTGEIARAFQDSGVRDVRCFPGLPPEGWTRHASAYYLECVGASPTWTFRLALPEMGAPRDVVIHPGSGSPRKNWPLPCFHTLARCLSQKGRRVTWCLGPAEEGMTLGEGIETLPAMRLVELGGMLASAECFVGNDSGITHLAVAVGCPTVAIFGPSDPNVWAPRAEHVRVVRGEPWPEMEAVLEEVLVIRS